MSHNQQAANELNTDFTVSRGEQVNTGDALQEVLFSTIVEQIKSGGDGLKDKIERIRAVESDTDRRDLKKKLPYFVPGKFKDGVRQLKCFISADHIVYDYDHLAADKLAELKDKFRTDSRTVADFISPSGTGLKVMFKLPAEITDAGLYKLQYEAHGKAISAEYGVEWDPSTKDSTHACFLSYDPDIYVNVEAAPLPVLDLKQKVATASKKSVKKDELISAVGGVSDGNRTSAAAKLIGVYISKQFDRKFTQELMQAWNKGNNPPQSEAEIDAIVDDMFDRYAKEHGAHSFAETCKDLWSYETNFLEMGIAPKGSFYMHNIGKEKVYSRTYADSPDQKTAVFNYLARDKHIKHIDYVSHLGDASIDTPYYKVIPDEARIEARVPAIASDVQDNAFIETYLERTFGRFTSFIKQYLAVYCYTNHKKLPTLILIGERGTGKNTFAEMMMEIYKPISDAWDAEKRNFNPEATQKLVIADETVTSNKKTYDLLKQMSGQKYLSVNLKYVPNYKVQNNMNIIILSNHSLPIFTEREEMPTSEQNNQFFMYEFSAVIDSLDLTFGEQLRSRLGHYIRTELKDVFAKVDMTGNRYAIKVPITDTERTLFQSSISDTDAQTDKEIERLIDQLEVDSDSPLKAFYTNGFILRSFFDNHFKATDRKAIERNMVKRKLFESANAEKRQVRYRSKTIMVTDRKPAFVMTQKLKAQIATELAEREKYFKMSKVSDECPTIFDQTDTVIASAA